MSPAPLGQNFLASASWRERIVNLLNVRDTETWIEIGAGHGEMTELLAARARFVFAIEVDSHLAAGLRPRAWRNAKIIEADVLATNIAQLAGAARYRIYGSIPYYITSPILHHIFAQERRPDIAYLVMQLEVAERLVSPPGHRAYGYLSAATQFHSAPEIVCRIPPGAFKPPPKVDSALVRLKFPGASASLRVSDSADFLNFVQACFSQKRKTIANNLRAIAAKKTFVDEILAKTGISPSERAEQLTLQQFVALYDARNSLA